MKNLSFYTRLYGEGNFAVHKWLKERNGGSPTPPTPRPYTLNQLEAKGVTLNYLETIGVTLNELETGVIL